MCRFLNSLILIAAFIALMPLPARADCQSDYNDAMGKLAKAKAQAMDPNAAKLDPQSFMQDFQGDIDRMKDQQCTEQIMQILQFVQSEATRYPAPPGSMAGSAPAAGGMGMPTFGGSGVGSGSSPNSAAPIIAP